MKREIIVAGFGGQGVMSIGKTLVQAGMEEGLEVTWVPSYGPEMRGGTANCSVILSSVPIGSPVISHPTELIAMNTPSLNKFAHTVAHGGIIFINGEAPVPQDLAREVKVVCVPCSQIALELGSPKVSNMVMLGAYVGATGALEPETLRAMLCRKYTGPKAKHLERNLAALEQGLACGKKI